LEQALAMLEVEAHMAPPAATELALSALERALEVEWVLAREENPATALAQGIDLALGALDTEPRRHRRMGRSHRRLLLVYGLNSSNSFSFKLPSGSSTICGAAQCTSNASFSATLTDASNIGVTNRFLPGEVLYRAFVYVAGGLTGNGPTDTAQSTVDRIQY
jgi:hypothetical protein